MQGCLYRFAGRASTLGRNGGLLVDEGVFIYIEGDGDVDGLSFVCWFAPSS